MLQQTPHTTAWPVAVVIPIYNSTATLAAALQSIYAQTHLPAEIIVVDDGSTDDVAAILAVFQLLPHLNLRLIRQANLGAAAARNTGLAATRQPVVAFLDADDTWEPTKLFQTFTFLQRGNYALVYHDFYKIHGFARRAVRSSRFTWGREGAFTAFYLRNFIATSTVMARRDTLLAAGGFNPALRYGEDYDLWLRITAEFPHAIGALPLPLACWYDTPGSLSKCSLRLYLSTLTLAWRQRTHVRRQCQWPWLVFFARLALIHIQLLRDCLHPGTTSLEQAGYLPAEW